MSRVDIVRRAVQKRYKKLGNWRLVADEYGLPSRTVWRFAMRGYEPKREDIREKLGLGRRRRTKDGRRRLMDWPVEELRRALEERKEMR